MSGSPGSLLRILYPHPYPHPHSHFESESVYVAGTWKSAFSYTCPEASLLPVEDALLAPWLPHPSTVGVFCWRGWGLESPGEPEWGAQCKIRLGYLSVLGVGHGCGLLTDMYNAHLTKVRVLGTACLSLHPFPGGHW